MKYTLRVASAQMPSSCWGTYKRIGILEHPDDVEPTAIRDNAKAGIRVVRTWERLSVGKTEKCAYQQALREAEAMLKNLRGEQS